MSGALEGIRVIEAADQYGEWCGKLLADMGADVIKIEPPEGSATRSIGPYASDDPHPERSLYFWHYNTSKRGITLDIERPEHRDVLTRLLDTADVFLETLPPGRADEPGLGHEALALRNPRLVHVAITPFGQTGPYVDAAYETTDLVTMALGGPMQSCGYDLEDGDVAPVRPGANHSYHTASHYAGISTLIALYEREASGLGQYIDVSAQAALGVTVEFASLYWEYAGQVVRRQTGRHAYPQTTARTQYICADGKPINLALPLTDAAWRRLLAYLRSEDLGAELDDDAYTDPAKRLEQGGKVYAELEVLAAKHTAEELFHAGQRLGMTWGAVRAPEDWIDDEHARARGFFVEVAHPELGRSITYPGAPYKFSDTPWRISRRAPMVGEHNTEVFGEVGMSAAEIERMN